MRLFHVFKKPEDAGPVCDICSCKFGERDDFIVPRIRIEGINRICRRCSKQIEDEFYKPLIEIMQRLKEAHS